MSFQELHSMTVDEYRAAADAQGVARKHYAAKCPVCGTVQSMASLVAAGVDKADVDRFWGFSCIGRFTNAGPFRKGDTPGKGCDWTLGGLLHLHTLEVVTEDEKRHPRFELASPAEAKELEKSLEGK